MMDIMKDKNMDDVIRDAVKDNNDLAFYDDFEAPPAFSEFSGTKSKGKSSVRRMPFYATAAVLLIVAISGIALYNSGVIDLSSPDVQVGKEERGDVVLVVNDINDTEAMEEAFTIFPGLEIEETLFDDYKFKNLTLMQNDKKITAISTYSNPDGHEITIEQTGNSSLIEKSS